MSSRPEPTAVTASRPRWQYAAGVLVVAALAWLTYAPALGGFFRDDDFWWLDTARKWADGSLGLLYAPAGVTPLYSLYYYALYHTFGLNPQPYFLTLLACHALVSCLVLALVWLLTKRFVAALAGGAVFAVLYCHHEAVTWPAGGPHVFASLGIVLALLCWTLQRQGRGWCLPLAVCFAVTATFTKDSGIAVVPLLLVLDLSFFPGRRRAPLLWLLLPVVALLAWRTLLPPIDEPSGLQGPTFGPGLHVLWNMIHDVPQMVFPDLRFENYERFAQRLLPATAVPVAQALANGLILLLSALALWAVLRGSRALRTGVLWCYAGFLPFAPFAYDFARAPRYLYIPSIGFAVLAGLAALTISDRAKRPWRTVAVVLAVGYLVGSFGFGRLVCQHRLEESAQRRAILAALQSRIPNPHPGTEIILAGLPARLEDITMVPHLAYGRPLNVHFGTGQAKPGAYLLRFEESNPGKLVEFRPPLAATAASAHTPPSGHPGGSAPGASAGAVLAPPPPPLSPRRR